MKNNDGVLNSDLLLRACLKLQSEPGKKTRHLIGAFSSYAKGKCLSGIAKVPYFYDVWACKGIRQSDSISLKEVNTYFTVK